ncbi:TetR/AcrR family transcriptional regulator [Actinomadura montaniterrae]|uniref:TetR/AcrR family transcriptional regulator n=1 Tax=Actinomadura montaniterrae TaxID=1803903 RepID=A0A6L3VFG0_9ACTN|nr:TetR/AcrR family transcriptional regulator [Actinomadura montaniterrae]KAB2365046.1 TetR/AcrR family transcriptional regulator [Actinomadura montaniterrae]
MAESTSRPTPSAGGRPRDARIDDAVRRAVVEILNEAGYSGLTMEAAAARAGTTKPAIRRRWRSRQHLVIDALATTIGTAPTPDTGCTHCDLIAGISTLSDAFTTALGRRALPALVADLAGDPALERHFFELFFHPRRATTAAALRRGIERGDLWPGIDVDLLLDMLASTTYYRVLFGHLPVTPELAADVVGVILSGVATDQWRGCHPAG